MEDREDLVSLITLLVLYQDVRYCEWMWYKYMCTCKVTAVGVSDSAEGLASSPASFRPSFCYTKLHRSPLHIDSLCHRSCSPNFTKALNTLRADLIISPHQTSPKPVTHRGSISSFPYTKRSWPLTTRAFPPWNSHESQYPLTLPFHFETDRWL